MRTLQIRRLYFTPPNNSPRFLHILAKLRMKQITYVLYDICFNRKVELINNNSTLNIHSVLWDTRRTNLPATWNDVSTGCLTDNSCPPRLLQCNGTRQEPSQCMLQSYRHSLSVAGQRRRDSNCKVVMIGWLNTNIGGQLYIMIADRHVISQSSYVYMQTQT